MNNLNYYILKNNRWEKLDFTPETIMNFKHVILYDNVNGFFQPIGIGLY